MINKKKILGSTLALAAAVAFSATPTLTSAGSSSKQVHCYGVNSCKGKGECQTATSTCKGGNACKGKGAKMMSKKQCLKKGGKIMPKG